jgi:hypothetical protein
VTGDWRDFRPAIWLAMAGVAVALLVNPAYVGAALIGGSIGVAARVQRRRRPRALPEPRRRRPRR